MLLRSVLLLFVFGFINCTGKKDTKETVFNQTLEKAVSQITESYDLNNNNLVIHNFYPDKAKETYVYLAIEDFSDSLQWKKMLSELAFSNDSLMLKMGQIANNNFTLFTHEDEPDSVIFNSNFFGSINLSNVVLSDKGDEACFYIALQCGSSCGDGWIVFLENTDNHWKIRELLKIWD